MTHVKIKRLFIVVCLCLPLNGYCFFGSLMLLAPMITTSIYTAKTANQTKRLVTEVQKTNVTLDGIIDEMRKNSVAASDIQKIGFSIYGRKKLAGDPISITVPGGVFKDNELDLSDKITKFRERLQLDAGATSTRPGTLLHTNIVFHEKVDSNNLADLELKATNNLAFEVEVFKHLTELKSEFDATGANTRHDRYLEYIDRLNDTLTLKSSVDFNNLLVLENLIQNKYALEVQVHDQLINLYQTINKASQAQITQSSAGVLTRFTMD